MRASSSLLASSGMAIGVTAIAIAVMLLASNFTIINAQQVTSQPGEIENGITTTFQSTSDSFSIQVPSGWIIQDIDNAGPAQLDEVTRGYGILMQLCPEEQGAAAPSNASGSTNVISSVNASRCQVAQEVIHIIRYPDLDTRLSANNVTTANNITTTATIDNILTYHMQKLQDVGYRSMRIVNSTDMTSNLIDPETNETLTTVPGKLVEMTYSSNFAPDEMRRGYFILAAANETVPNVGTTKGYSVFYEGNSTTTTTTPAEITTAAASLPLSPAVGEVLDSFELIAAPEVAQALAETAEDDDDDEEDNGAEEEDDDNGGGDDDEEDDDNGGGDDDGAGDNDEGSGIFDQGTSSRGRPADDYAADAEGE
jgi:hypothetical protein